MEPATRNNLLALAAITVLGAVLRLYQIGFNSIWLDEAFSDAYASQSFLTIWQKFPTDVHPPLFYWIEHIFIFFLGHSETALRIFPAICGILAVPVIYFIGKEWIDSKTGLVAATISALSLFSIFYSQDARMYTLTLLFCSFGLYYWLKWRKDKNNWNLAIVTGLFFGLATWSHFYAGIMVAILIFIDVSRSFRYSVVWFISILPLVPAGVHMIGQINEAIYTSDIISGQLIWVFGSQNIIGFIGMVTALILGSLWLYREERDFVIPFILAASLALILIIGLKSNIAFRYFIWLVPFVSVGMASGITHTKSRLVSVLLLTLIIVGAGIGLSNYYTIPDKTDWRGAAELFGPGDTVFVVPEYNTFPMNYYEKDARVIGISSLDDYRLVEPLAEGSRQFIVVGPGGKDQDLLNWTETLPVEKRLLGITIYRIQTK